MSTFHLWQRQSGKTLPTEPLARLVEQVLHRLQLGGREVGLSLVGDAEITDLNRKYLGRDRSTNVLSFESGEPGELGELILNVEYAAREAEEAGVTLLYIIGFYVIHGLLHLAGYDHERSGPQEAARMEARQEEMQDLLAAMDPFEGGR